MADEATLVIIKPDAIQRGLVGAVWSRLETLRLEVVGAKAAQVSKELAEIHYSHLREKPFFGELVDYLQGKLHGTSYVLAFVLWGERAIARVRDVVGATHPEQADPSSIRGAFGRITTAGVMENLVHASSDAREAQREIPLWFKPHELLRSRSPTPPGRGGTPPTPTMGATSRPPAGPETSAGVTGEMSARPGRGNR